MPIIYTDALSIKLVNENHLKIEGKPIVVDKIFNEPKPIIFEQHNHQNSQTVFENLYSL